MPSKDFQSVVQTDLTVLIDGGATSTAADLFGTRLVGFIIPVSMAGTAITFTMSDSLAGTYVPVRTSAGSALSITITSTAGFYALNTTEQSQLSGVQFIKLVSGASETTKTIRLVTRP